MFGVSLITYADTVIFINKIIPSPSISKNVLHITSYCCLVVLCLRKHLVGIALHGSEYRLLLFDQFQNFHIVR